MEGEAEEDWACTLCDRSHYNHALRNCRICGTSRTTASATAATPGRSPEEVAAARAKLLAGGLDPGPLADTLRHFDAKLRSLDAPSAPPDAYEVFEHARLAEAKASTFFDKLTDKAKEIEDRMSALEKDLDASVRGMANAHQEHNQAKAALAAATAALQLNATTAAPAAREEVFPQHARADFMQAIMQAITQTFAETQDKEHFL